MSYYSQIKWVDEYINNVAPYIYVREQDHLLIKIPNEAYKLNNQGVKILKHLLSGESVYTIIDEYSDKEKVAFDTHNFFCDLRAVLKGCYHEQVLRRAIERISFSLPFNTLPVLSEVAVTYRCNLACKFCYASCGCNKNEKVKEIGTEDIKQLLSIIKDEAEVPSVSFTGGEPTLRDDLPELINYAKSLNMWTNLITNGTLITKEAARSFNDAGLDSAQVSLEGGDSTLHDTIVQKEGAFSLAIEGLMNLCKSGIRVHTNTTISSMNKDHLFSILDAVKDLGFDRFSMNMLMPQGAALNNLDEVIIRYLDIGNIVLDVAGYAHELGLEFMWYSPTPMCIFNPIVHGLGNKGCAACDGLLSIAPNGDILPCSSFPRPMGNILKMKGHFKELWRGADFAFFQKKRFAHERCKKCEYLEICNGGCPLYWKQVGFEEILQERKGVLV